MTNISKNNFHTLLLSWYEKNKRPLPWRKTPSFYAVWISEIMAQQTQMHRVVPYFTQWMLKFPSIEILAHAKEEEILKAWEGLGYYSRVRNIHKTAQLITFEKKGKLPTSYQELCDLPGIGDYTAAAILSIVHNYSYPVYDANVERIFTRLFAIKENPKEKHTKDILKNICADFFLHDNPREYNQAIMEFGALICTPKNPHCTDCFFQKLCQAKYDNLVQDIPFKKKTTYISIHMVTGALFIDGKFYIQKRKDGDVWAGLWEFPGGAIEENESPKEALIREYMEETDIVLDKIIPATIVKNTYTKYRVTMHCFYCTPKIIPCNPSLNEASQGLFLPLEELSNFAYPSGHKKFLAYLQTDITWKEQL